MMQHLLSFPLQLKRLRVTVGWGLSGRYSFPAILNQDSLQQVLLSVSCGSHGGVVLGKAAASLPGGSCWQRQLWLCVFSKSPCPFQLPFLPLYKRSSLMAFTLALTPVSPKAGSSFEHVCTQPSSVFVGPIKLASTDVTGLQEC